MLLACALLVLAFTGPLVVWAIRTEASSKICTQVGDLRYVTIRALTEAKKRARASLPPGDPRLVAALRELDAEIALLQRGQCKPRPLS